MELYLQYGHGMMEHSRFLIREWRGGTVILSPRDLDHKQILKMGEDVSKLDGGNVLVDPQFYLPNSDHVRLRSHAYWPDDYSTGPFWAGNGVEQVLEELEELNFEAKSSAFILPGLLASEISDDWLSSQNSILQGAKNLNGSWPIFQTLCLGSDVLRSEEQVEELLETIETTKVDGFYLVCEHPSDDYLVEDPIWLANLLDIAAGIKLSGKTVILGYCNHQLLLACLAKVDAISSGTWMNVRHFPPGKFAKTEEGTVKKRATWFYSPKTLSEYKMVFLDIAYRQGVLVELDPGNIGTTQEARNIFRGVQPSSIEFGERDAFRHYLTCLQEQTKQFSGKTYEETYSGLNEIYDIAESSLSILRKKGILGQNRDFADYIDICRSAMAIFDGSRGPMLKRAWGSI